MPSGLLGVGVKLYEGQGTVLRMIAGCMCSPLSVPNLCK